MTGRERLDPAISIAGRWRVVADALLAPPADDARPQVCGVFDGLGRPVAESLCFSTSGTVPATAFPPAAPEPAGRLSGTWLFGGVLSGHFGHMLVEATARLWALDDSAGKLPGPVRGTLYFPRPVARARQIGRDHGPFVALFGAPAPQVVTRPALVERLLVPEQGLGAGELMSGTPEARRHLRAHLCPDIPATGGRRLFLSRAAIPARRGVVLAEEAIEALFSAEGYEIIRPETLGPREQVALYRQADCIAGTEGSPFHLVAFAAPEACRVAVLRRRPGPAFDQICDSLAWFLGRPTVAVGEIRSALAREKLKNPNMIYLELSLTAMWRQLREAGMISGTVPWAELDQTALAASVTRIASELGRPLRPFDLSGAVPDDSAEEAA